MRIASAAVALAAAVVAVSVLAGCSSGPGTPTGTVTGYLEIVGGPVTQSGQTASHGLPGTITAVSGSVTRQGTAAGNGAFTLVLPTGTYTLSGTSPQFNGGNGSCMPTSPVTVVTGATTHVDIICPVP